MEETVGKFWDRFITRAARVDYPQAAVSLEEMSATIGIFFRAMSGDPGLQVDATSATYHGARRHWLQRIAGSNRQTELAWQDDHSLRLPSRIAIFKQAALNRDLYLWLAALAADDANDSGEWFKRNQWHTCRVLRRFPGLRSRYQRLMQAHLDTRPDCRRLPEEEARQERAIQAALRQPGSVTELPGARRPPQSVPLWLHPDPPCVMRVSSSDEDALDQESVSGESRRVKDKRRRQGERVDMPDGRRGLLFYRFETILSWAEYVKVDRCSDDEEDMEAAAAVLDDLDRISLARDQRGSAKRLNFDLDLPAAAYDDTPLDRGVLFPEWDYRSRQCKEKQCMVQTLVAADAQPCPLPGHLRAMAARLRAQFASLAPAPIWHRSQQEGTEVDLDAYMQHASDRMRGQADSGQGLYRDRRRGKRDMSCLVLADFSLSTDSWLNNDMRIIDIIRDTLFLFSEALWATGDRFALYGFSSRSRRHVRMNWLKGFNEAYNQTVRGRLAAIRPGFYTRLGAAIRYTTKVLARQPESERLLLILTDGKPNDLDHYEGRYGIEDTRQAIHEARKQGLRPFCVTIDDEAADYLPHLFGNNGFVVIRRPAELPRRLPLLYAQLTR